MTLLALQELCARAEFTKSLVVLIVGPQKGYEPESEAQQEAWSRQDAQWALAPYRGLLGRDFAPTLALSAEAKTGALAAAADIAMNGALSDADKLARLVALGDDVFRGSAKPAELSAAAKAFIEQSNAALQSGHYLAAMVRYGREWFWGIDRLGHLEAALQLSPRKYVLNRLPKTLPPLGSTPGKLEVFYSFRSPYSQLAVAGLKQLRASGVRIDVRAVLPMVMRGLPVPLRKQLYILKDAAREARELGIGFGTVADPVGKPVERAFVALHVAHQSGRELEFLGAWGDAVFARGIAAGTDAGLASICADAGVDWPHVQRALGDDAVDRAWRQRAEENRRTLYEAGLWGVPSFRVVDAAGRAVAPAAWGQDRLFVVAAQLAAASAAKL